MPGDPYGKKPDHGGKLIPKKILDLFAQIYDVPGVWQEGHQPSVEQLLSVIESIEAYESDRSGELTLRVGFSSFNLARVQFGVTEDELHARMESLAVTARAFGSKLQLTPHSSAAYVNPDSYTEILVDPWGEERGNILLLSKWESTIYEGDDGVLLRFFSQDQTANALKRLMCAEGRKPSDWIDVREVTGHRGNITLDMVGDVSGKLLIRKDALGCIGFGERPEQVLVEIHHDFTGDGLNSMTTKSYRLDFDTAAVAQKAFKALGRAWSSKREALAEHVPKELVPTIAKAGSPFSPVAKAAMTGEIDSVPLVTSALPVRKPPRRPKREKPPAVKAKPLSKT